MTEGWAFSILLLCPLQISHGHCLLGDLSPVSCPLQVGGASKGVWWHPACQQSESLIGGEDRIPSSQIRKAPSTSVCFFTTLQGTGKEPSRPKVPFSKGRWVWHNWTHGVSQEFTPGYMMPNGVLACLALPQAGHGALALPVLLFYHPDYHCTYPQLEPTIIKALGTRLCA